MVKVSTDISAQPGTRFTLEFAAGNSAVDYEYAIQWFLERQPGSWHDMAQTIEQMLDLIYSGYYSIILLRDNYHNSYVAMLVYSLRDCTHGMQATIEMVTCSKFHRTIKFLREVEEFFRKLGCFRVRTMAHPTIAQYLAARRDYSVAGIVVEKTLDVRMCN